MFVDLLFTWNAYLCLKVKSRVLKCEVMKPMTELLKPLLDSLKPMLVVFKHKLEVQT